MQAWKKLAAAGDGRADAMAWLIPITEWQTDVTERAIIILSRANPSVSTSFAVVDRELTAPAPASFRNYQGAASYCDGS